MGRTLTDEDVDALASRIITLVAKRLAEPPPPPPAAPAPQPLPEPPVQPALANASPPRLAFTLKELAAQLGVSKPTIYRLEARGLLKSLPYLRTKVYSKREVERFLDAQNRMKTR